MTVVHISPYVCFAPTSLMFVFFFLKVYYYYPLFLKIYLFTLFLSALGLFAVCGRSLVVAHGLLTAGGSLVLWSRGSGHMGFSSCGS